MKRKLSDWRYRCAERLGRALVGGRLERLEASISEAARAIAELRQRVVDLENRETAPPAELGPSVGRPPAGALAAWQERLEALERNQRHLSRSLHYLAAKPQVPSGERRGRELLVSVVVPVRNRSAPLRSALESVLRQEHLAFEVLVIDDGSTDRTLEVARSLAARDPRIRVFEQPWLGSSAARSRGLLEARGEIVVYLDSDVLMMPGYLVGIAEAYAEDPELRWTYAARLIEFLGETFTFIQFEPFDRIELERYNYIDTNVIAHRRGLEQELGGWDESLVITADWDLALRWSARVEPRALPLLACRYELGRPDQLTLSEPHGYDNFRVRSRHARWRDLGLRVLYVVARHPQLTESFVDQEIRAARANGVHVEAWGLEPTEAPFPTDVVFHQGTLAEAVAAARPDLLQVHWLDAYFQRCEDLRATGLPIFVRGHGYELTEEKVDRLEADPAVSTVFLVPHFTERWSKTGKVVPAWVGFRPDLYYPDGHKDRRLVFRAAAGLPAKNLEALFELAARNPELRFVLAVGRVGGQGEWVDGLLERHRSSGSPLEIHVDLRREQVAELSRRAGIYLYTQSPEQPFSSPISIVEAMASGSYVLVPRCPPAERYSGEAAGYYGDLAEAERLLRATLEWPEAEWQTRRRLAIDRAFDHFVADIAILPVLKCWLGALGRSWPD